MSGNFHTIRYIMCLFGCLNTIYRSWYGYNNNYWIGGVYIGLSVRGIITRQYGLPLCVTLACRENVHGFGLYQTRCEATWEAIIWCVLRITNWYNLINKYVTTLAYLLHIRVWLPPERAHRRSEQTPQERTPSIKYLQPPTYITYQL